MKNTLVHATTLQEVVIHEFSWIDTLLRNGVDEYQLAFYLSAVINKTPRYKNSIPVIVSNLKECIQAQYFDAA